MKRTPALLAIAAATALLLTGCSGGSGSGLTEDASGEACTAGGSASESVKVEGEFGGELELTSETPISSEGIERTVLTEGAGKAPEEGDAVKVSMTTFNGSSGEVVRYDPTNDIEMSKDGLNGWAYEAFRCSQLEQRVALVVPAADVLGESSPEEAGIADMTAEDSFVIVMDFGDGCPDPTPRDEKYPEVDLGDGSEEPKITIPSCMEPPTEFELEVLEEGDGEVVKDGDTVMTRYVGVDWNGAARFDGNWSEEGFEMSTDGVIEGFKQAMVGQKVGSIVLVTMPPELGYDDEVTRTFVLELVKKVE